MNPRFSAPSMVGSTRSGRRRWAAASPVHTRSALRGVGVEVSVDQAGHHRPALGIDLRRPAVAALVAGPTSRHPMRSPSMSSDCVGLSRPGRGHHRRCGRCRSNVRAMSKIPALEVQPQGLAPQITLRCLRRRPRCQGRTRPTGSDGKPWPGPSPAGSAALSGHRRARYLPASFIPVADVAGP